MKNKNLGLSEDEFNKMVEGLRNGSNEYFEYLFRELFIKTYEKIKSTMNIPEGDAKDATVEALYDLRKKIINGTVKYGNINYLFNMMARRKFMSKYKKAKKGEIFWEGPYIEEEVIDEEEPKEWEEEDFLKLEMAIDKLDEKCKDLLNNIFYKHIDTVLIARWLGINLPTLRKRKQRCLDKVRQYLQSNISQ